MRPVLQDLDLIHAVQLVRPVQVEQVAGGQVYCRDLTRGGVLLRLTLLFGQQRDVGNYKSECIFHAGVPLGKVPCIGSRRAHSPAGTLH